MAQIFTEMDIGVFLLVVGFYILAVFVAAGFLFANKSGFKDELRAVSVFIAVISVLFFAFEQRNNKLSRDAQEAIDVLLDTKDRQLSEFQPHIAEFCRLGDIDPDKLRNEVRILVTYCDEIDSRNLALNRITERRIRRNKLDFTEFSNRLVPAQENRNDAVETKLSKSNEELMHAHNAMQAKVADSEKGEIVENFFYVFVFLLATGAAIDIASDNRAKFKAVRQWLKPAADQKTSMPKTNGDVHDNNTG